MTMTLWRCIIRSTWILAGIGEGPQKIVQHIAAPGRWAPGWSEPSASSGRPGRQHQPRRSLDPTDTTRLSGFSTSAAAQQQAMAQFLPLFPAPDGKARREPWRERKLYL